MFLKTSLENHELTETSFSILKSQNLQRGSPQLPLLGNPGLPLKGVAGQVAFFSLTAGGCFCRFLKNHTFCCQFSRSVVSDSLFMYLFLAVLGFPCFCTGFLELWQAGAILRCQVPRFLISVASLVAENRLLGAQVSAVVTPEPRGSSCGTRA